MCFKVLCNQCGKYTWGGCGAHLKSLYPTIERGMHCTCRPWPGVVIPVDTNMAVVPTETTAASTADSSASSSN